MDTERNPPVGDPRVYLAAERTYLAWVRTSLGLMGFGFLIARFGVLVDPTGSSHILHGPHSPIPPVLGSAIVAFGVGVCAVAAIRHRAYVRDLRAGIANPDLHLRTPLVVAAVLALAGLSMTFVILNP